MYTRVTHLSQRKIDITLFFSSNKYTVLLARLDIQCRSEAPHSLGVRTSRREQKIVRKPSRLLVNTPNSYITYLHSRIPVLLISFTRSGAVTQRSTLRSRACRVCGHHSHEKHSYFNPHSGNFTRTLACTRLKTRPLYQVHKYTYSEITSCIHKSCEGCCPKWVYYQLTVTAASTQVISLLISLTG